MNLLYEDSALKLFQEKSVKNETLTSRKRKMAVEEELQVAKMFLKKSEEKNRPNAIKKDRHYTYVLPTRVSKQQEKLRH